MSPDQAQGSLFPALRHLETRVERTRTRSPLTGLTPREAEFVRHYGEVLNAAEAARRAGYSVRMANRIGWEVLQKPHIRAQLGDVVRRPTRVWKNRQSRVYLIQEQFGAVKIGVSVHPGNRLIDLQVGYPYELSLLHEFPTPNARRVEAELHARYADKRLRGEWFRLSPEDVEELVQEYPSDQKPIFRSPS